MKRFLMLLLSLCVLMLASCTDDVQQTTSAGEGNEPPLEENQDPDDPLGGEGDGDHAELPKGEGEDMGNTGSDNEGTGDENEQKPSGDVELPKVPLP